MSRDEIINGLISRYDYKSYLEIGLDRADNFVRINCENKESVDPFIQDENHTNLPDGGDLPDFVLNNLTYRTTSDIMFAFLPEDKKYDIVFIDGLHTKEQVYKDIVNSFKHLNEGGTIILHDCLPKEEVCQIVPRECGEWNGDVWKVLPVLNSYGIQYNVVDDDWGVCVIPYQEALSKLELEKFDGPILEYNQVFSNIEVRNRVLNVISPEEFSAEN